LSGGEVGWVSLGAGGCGWVEWSALRWSGGYRGGTDVTQTLGHGDSAASFKPN